jgi:hypothetical protein
MTALTRLKRKPHENWQARIWRMLGISQLVDQSQLQRNINYVHFSGCPCPKYQRAKVPFAHHHRYKPRYHAIKFKNKELVFVFHSFEWLDDYHVKLTPDWTRRGRRSVIVNCVTAQIEWGNHYGLGPPSDPFGILRGGLPKCWDSVGEHFVLGTEFLPVEHFPQRKEQEYRDEYTSDFGDDE